MPVSQLDRLWQEYEPVGVLEETLVQRIATCLWRLARVLRAENGEIRKRLDWAIAEGVLRASDNAAKGTGVGSAGDTGNLVEISCLLQKRS